MIIKIVNVIIKHYKAIINDENCVFIGLAFRIQEANLTSCEKIKMFVKKKFGCDFKSLRLIPFIIKIILYLDYS